MHGKSKMLINTTHLSLYQYIKYIDTINLFPIQYFLWKTVVGYRLVSFAHYNLMIYTTT